ncbi:hypothetical protein NL676_022989 [Syzygium grande]|nr:hypothetical protein NL676_022989 [Syzygium grande]
MGGLVLSMAMERFPEKIAVAVFAAAVMPGPHLTYHSILEEHSRRVEYNMDPIYWFDDGPEQPPTYISFGLDFLASKVYPLSPPEVRLDAGVLLRAAFHLHPDQDKMEEEIAVMKDRYGLVRRVYIVCDQDLLLMEGLQRWMVEMNPLDEVKVIFSSDHMVMFSKPLELCASLEEIEQHY